MEKEFDAVLLATGFKNYGGLKNEIPIPELLIPIKKYLILKDEAISVTENYEILTNTVVSGKIFLNGLSESFHGIGDAGSLSLTSFRSKIILNQLLH